MAKFKKGDRVVTIGTGVYYTKGQVGTIDENDSTLPYVKMDNAENYSGGPRKRPAVSQHNLELLTEESIQSNYQIY